MAGTFDGNLTTEDPLSPNRLEQILQEATVGKRPAVLADFFVLLNSEILKDRRVQNVGKISWARQTLLPALRTNPALTIQTFMDLLEGMRLHYEDPLIEMLFLTSSEVAPLRWALADLVCRERKLLQLRERVLETILTRPAEELQSSWGGIESEGVLRFFNHALDELKNQPAGRVKDLCRDFGEKSKVILRLVADAERGTFDPAHISPSVREYRAIVQLLQESLLELASGATTPKCMRMVLDILKTARAVPAWHPAAPAGSRGTYTIAKALNRWWGGYLAPRGESLLDPRQAASSGSNQPARPSSNIILALIIDKATAMVLEVAAAEWGAGNPHLRNAAAVEDGWLSPSSPESLESALTDPGHSPKMRAMAAALLRILCHATPSVRLSEKSQLYADLWLMPCLSPPPYGPDSSRGPSLVTSQEKIPFLLEALNEKNDYVRRNAAAACLRAAREHPEWFQAKDYTALLPSLADEHHGVRLDIMRTFKVVASSRGQKTVSVIRDLSNRLRENLQAPQNEKHAPRDFETALGMTLDILADRVDELQDEVRRFEIRRRQLLDDMEKQAVRVGEEIHHEVLNSLCSDLSTAIDEQDCADAKKRLEDLVTELRRIMNNLYPKDLEAEGFLATIQKRLDSNRAKMQKRLPEFTIAFDCPADITDEVILRHLVHPSHLVLLYRIVLEAIINARKHSNGSFLGISFRRGRRDPIKIAVSDNGSGNGGPYPENLGIGLMRRRAEEIGGEIDYKRTSPGGGTTVTIRLAPAKNLRPKTTTGGSSGNAATQ
ncbi:MAG: hypothetical protein HY695_20470 [Deltaproteobacteria bacterium]|nr:hypothetical protein [Deltaproteobacteria bacterium]